ncbi:f-box domain-containing protein [Caerostris darwini]|uniref:F-box domain-containing protein n=1 Tax=Caerostris darwini TaxID=1538125 RepID=A0AAV4QBD4_9ARAC|nr:hypothetical protein CDAR_578271 [Caerostris darwini]GIY06757.1 f-box domain-containing protein [Caerostris darwini]
MGESSGQNLKELIEHKSESSVHILHLPDVIFLEIFSRINFTDLCMCSRVCRRWHFLAKDYTLKKKITIKKPLRNDLFLSLIQHHFTHFLEEFKILKARGQESHMSVSQNVLWKLTNKSINLKKLILMWCSLTSASLKDLPSSLEHLSIRGSEIFPDVFFGSKPNLHAPNLVCLDIGGVSNFLTSQDLSVFSTLKSLKALYLEGCFRVNNGGIESIIDILPQLEVLDVEGTDISNEGAILILNYCCNIRDLFLGHTVVDDLALSIADMQSLSHLSSFCVRNTRISSAALHAFLIHHLTSHKLIVRASFDCSGSCKCFNTAEIPISFEIDNAFPFLAGIKCQHYLSHKKYGIN